MGIIHLRMFHVSLCHVGLCFAFVHVLVTVVINCTHHNILQRRVYPQRNTAMAIRSIVFALIASETSGLVLKVSESPECKCTGMAGAEGTTFPEGSKQNGTAITYHADAGSSCKAWDDSVAASAGTCGGEGAPKWCTKKWCFVDPCSCGIKPPPKRSSYFPNARKNGRPVYYSYATCGSEDSWTASNHDKACPNQVDEAACGGVKACAWTGTKCVGKDLVEACS